jgi:hypothetical protein
VNIAESNSLTRGAEHSHISPCREHTDQEYGGQTRHEATLPE